MGRIQNAFKMLFRSILIEMGARAPDKGVDWLLSKATSIATNRRIPQTEALIRVTEVLLQKHAVAVKTLGKNLDTPSTFWCDAGLGGLARWLRAAGYVAKWVEGIKDADLLGHAIRDHAAVVTTDSLLLERRQVTTGTVKVFWVPPACGVEDQMRLVIRRWNLRLRNPLCMICAGTLEKVTKESVRDRIPPRTYRWLDEYFLCTGCGQLFWRGTHWQKIRNKLEHLVGQHTDSNASVEHES
ncbi:MAG: Mut7-C RNAse domain-containing protein [Verrucomicrobiae bacterium]|nr:Mut7-C RNAse domain-containing protein [Verrucomicrobiae bacterium]